jgi:hypothetical protein
LGKLKILDPEEEEEELMLPLVKTDDEIKAIADSKIAVIFIFFHMSVWFFWLHRKSLTLKEMAESDNHPPHPPLLCWWKPFYSI